MKKLLQLQFRSLRDYRRAIGTFVFSLCLIFFCFNEVVAPIHASSVEPQPPFSVEGNPKEDYHFDYIFPLFGYIRAPALEIYENRERTRNYVDVEVCGGAEHDRRDYECNNQGDTCDGGDVDLCHRGTDNVSRTDHSSNGSCRLNKKKDDQNPGELIEGKCDYSMIPRIYQKFKGTDYSNTSLTVYDKIQSKSGAYNNVGTDNAITWGSQHLSLDMGQKVINQLIVVKRAKQTKGTVRETGEWPLGWVDWGYKTPNGKTLLEIDDELPDGIASAGTDIVYAMDLFFLSAGDPESMLDISASKEYVINTVANAARQNPPPEWVTDLLQAPLYAPSWRQGFVRPSICVWEICRPGLRGSAPQPLGTKRGLYYDNSISQAFGASIDNLFATYSLDQGSDIFHDIAVKNPLVRFLTNASPKAIPSRISLKLDKELNNPCLQYTKKIWIGWGAYMDYVNPGDFFDTEKKCPAWQIAPEMSKENAAAFDQSPLEALIAMIWGQKQDQVDEVVYHLLTVPDAMAQSIQELQQPVYDSRDTLTELESVKDFNANLSNTVDDNTEGGLYGGETPLNPPRYLGYYTCSDDMFSSQLDTSIEAYALGTRIGCDQKSNTSTTGKCDGTKFAKIIADSPWKAPTPAATQVVLNSAMFVDGKLNPKLEEAYAKTEAKTGVPCEVLAGHHFEEASSHFTDTNDPELYSAANGGLASRDGGLQATVDNAANTILNYPITNTAKLIASMSNFNGGGNANCQPNFPGGTIPYGGCPRTFVGEDDPYVTNMLDAKHNSMYLLYCGDFLPCTPPKTYGTDRPGAFAVALAVYNEATSKNSPASSGSPKPSTSSVADYGKPPSTGTSLNPAGDCGDGYINTALGCLPYERKEFIMSLLRFLVGISGAISLVVMLMGTIQIQTSSGDPKKIQSGRDLFTAAIAGLLFLILSSAILRIVGFDILKLPGF